MAAIIVHMGAPLSVDECERWCRFTGGVHGYLFIGELAVDADGGSWVRCWNELGAAPPFEPSATRFDLEAAIEELRRSPPRAGPERSRFAELELRVRHERLVMKYPRPLSTSTLAGVADALYEAVFRELAR